MNMFFSLVEVTYSQCLGNLQVVLIYSSFNISSKVKFIPLSFCSYKSKEVGLCQSLSYPKFFFTAHLIYSVFSF